MQHDSDDAVTALYRLAAAQMELHDALVQLRATCEQTAATLRGASSPGDPTESRSGTAPVEHPDLVELDAMLTEFYG